MSCHGHQCVSHFLITSSDPRNVIDRVKQCGVQWDALTAPTSWDYIMPEGRRENPALETYTVVCSKYF